jgi:hypothetical protein
MSDILLSIRSHKYDKSFNSDDYVFYYSHDQVEHIGKAHNYTSSAPGPVNSWIIESANGVIMIDSQRTLSEAENALDVITKEN